MLLNSKLHIDRRGANISQQLFYYIIHTYVMYFLSLGPLKQLTLRMDHTKLLDVLTSLPVSHVI